MTPLLAVTGELLVIMSVAILVVLLFHLARQPAIPGFILSGVLVGPSMFGLVHNTERIQLLAEIGVILLLFSLGVEFPFRTLKHNARTFFGLGGLQCLLTTAFLAAGALLSGVIPATAFCFGAIASVSSTAIVVDLLRQRKETQSPQGKASIAVLLFQDLWVIPLLVLIPVLSEGHSDTLISISSFGLGMLRAVLLGLILYVGHRWIVPILFQRVTASGIRELFVVVVALCALGLALITALLGFSLALGAFLAGALIAESEVGPQASAEVRPFRELFMALFFVSVGMLIDASFLANNLLPVLGLALIILVVKLLITAKIASLMGFESRVASLIGISLAQIGEFSFVLASEANNAGLFSELSYQFLLSTTMVLMFVTPSLFRFAPRISLGLKRIGFYRTLLVRKSKIKQREHATTRSGHVVIVGFGRNGQGLATALTKVSVPFSVVEINRESVRIWRKRGFDIVFGDASRREVLEAVGFEEARAAVVCISDPTWVHHVISAMRHLRPNLYILVRTNYLYEVDKLEAVGASDIVVGELETGMEIYARVLKHYGIDDTTIGSVMEDLQAEKYTSIRKFIGVRPEN